MLYQSPEAKTEIPFEFWIPKTETNKVAYE
jgi:hypothetical protein